jgi:hypothetical protein
MTNGGASIDLMCMNWSSSSDGAEISGVSRLNGTPKLIQVLGSVNSSRVIYDSGPSVLLIVTGDTRGSGGLMLARSMRFGVSVTESSARISKMERSSKWSSSARHKKQLMLLPSFYENEFTLLAPGCNMNSTTS